MKLVNLIFLLLLIYPSSYRTHTNLDGESIKPSLLPTKFDPEMGLNTTEIIKYNGYEAEEYKILTDDGYYIFVQRIPHGKKNSKKQAIPVLIMHGLDCSSASWVDNTPKKSLAFILADNGYDVWLGNIRGNPYGKEHYNISAFSKSFWEFSWDENGRFDLSCMIDFILQKTGQKSLYYIGHSMGTTMMFVLLSTRPEYNDKIKIFIALAPVAYVTHILPDYKTVFDNYNYIKGILMFFNQYELTPSPSTHSFLLNLLCRNKNNLCEEMLFAFTGKNLNLLNKTRIPLFMSHCTFGTSLRTLIHFMQVRSSDSFKKFDHGSRNANIDHYGIPIPPLYNLSNVIAPVALFWSENDPLAHPLDVAKLRHQLPSVILDYRIEYKNFTHVDFIWANNINDLLYNKVLLTLDMMNRLNTGKEIGF